MGRYPGYPLWKHLTQKPNAGPVNLSTLNSFPMKVLIVEDEPLAAERLEDLILQYESHIEILAKLESVEDTVNWLNSHPAPDLAFFDIQLADGLSFRIFDQVKFESPIIFTTAFDEYAIRAFQVNSIDYLLKPLEYEDLADALDKYAKLFINANVSKDIPSLETLQALMQSFQKPQKFKKRFVVKKGEHLVSVPVEETLYFYSEDKFTFLRMLEGQRYIIDFTLAELENQLNPEKFFRVNRQYLIAHEALQDIISYTHSRLKVRLKFSEDKNIVVSKQKVAEFKGWLEGE